ncbi:MAG: nitrate reductase subunit alpha [Bdellovibrionaceae bacterium]|nr:nitrate reductase subunit alpha [Bdellovibrionales bacterium]MCB9254180.1 nitrate reductase subunit alpha [Pseudobdellovibrionaceae bacterium]
MSWIEDIISPKTRQWEEFYRNRFQHDKVVRSTHGVNCTGGCSWQIAVKDGIVTWEMQALDYPIIDKKIPAYEPRGCQRGISFSWYLYSPIRVKYPYIRGSLLDIWAEAKKKYSDPVEAWRYIQKTPELRSRYQRSRGKGGLRRTTWDQSMEIIAAANIATIKDHGPDRITGFSPIPAMSMLSYGGGSRFLQLLGGVNLSFYDWYCDLPSASPETWGEQTDVAESADWYHSKFTAIMGANLNMTRTPDCHFMVESRHNGTKVVVFAPDFNQVAKFGDQWVPVNPGQDGAFWMAVNHVILKEFHHDKPSAYFLDYVKRFSDSPFLVELEKKGDSYVPGTFLRADRTEKYAKEEKGDWKFLMWDATTQSPKMPMGSIGHRWQKETGKWNLELKDGIDGSPIEPALTLLNKSDEVFQVSFDDFVSEEKRKRGVPVKFIETQKGRVPVATVYDLLMAQYGVNRGLEGNYPTSYDDADCPFTPAWQESISGISKETVIQFSREWATTADKTRGKCSIIIGAGVNHWYHANLLYRAGINALIFTGCVGRNGGGLNHYVGQEKLAPMASWSAIALGRDWMPGVRVQNAPSWHYMHSDQWRYERPYDEINASPGEHPITKGHSADLNAKAVRCGWLPFFPQFKDNPLDLCRKAQEAGAKTDDEIKKWILDQITSRKITPAIEDIDAPESFPRLWYIWRGNALMSSAKGHEFFLHHYLGTHHNQIAKEMGAGHVNEVKWHETAPTGKMDLIVDLNFRMDTSALYSDIILPAASWYEKTDLNSTDMHSYIHPLSAAIAPVWESKPDWDIFREITKKTAELAEKHLPDPVKDIITVPLQHDTIDELSQPKIQDWAKGECDPVPGKTMYKLAIVERDYKNLYNKFISLGPLVKKGLGAHGVSYDCADFYEEMLSPKWHTVEWGGEKYPSLLDAMDACNAVLWLAPETNGELAFRAYKGMETKTGQKLTDLAEGSRSVRMQFKDLLAAPKRLLSSPCWSGIVANGRTYSAFTYNVERQVPWRTLTGRQSLYLDHEGYRAFGEHLPTYKPRPAVDVYGDLDATPQTSPEGEVPSLRLNYLTPHGKWHIHSTYGDTIRMLTLSRGGEPFWLSETDATTLGIADNDWVEVHNDNGVVVTRACVSARIPKGVCIIYHSPERTYSAPKSPLRKKRRAGGHNSLTRVHLKPNLMLGGYAQFTYHFNYWGPTGCNRDTHIMVRRLDKVER